MPHDELNLASLRRALADRHDDEFRDTAACAALTGLLAHGSLMADAVTDAWRCAELMLTERKRRAVLRSDLADDALTVAGPTDGTPTERVDRLVVTACIYCKSAMAVGEDACIHCGCKQHPF